MNLLLRAQLRFFARAPWSALTALLGVALAVASIVAVHQIGAAVSSSLDAARPPHLAGLSHLLSRPELAAADYFRLRRAWRAGDVPGVEALVPIVEGYRELDGRRTLVLGADWLAYGGASMPGSAAVPSWRLLEGQAVVADRSLGVGPGGVLTIDGADYEVVAVVDGGLGPALFVDIALAQRLLDRSPDVLGFVGVATVDRWATARRLLDAAMPGIAAGLPEPSVPPHPALADFAVRAVASELPAAAFARAILFNLGALGLLALLVAWFLVHQVALIWVERQRPVFGRLHALGVSQLGLAAGFVAAFALLGLLATITGTGVGWWLARVLIHISAPDVAGDALPGRPDAVVLAKALLSGVGVCVIGGLLAFRRADGAAALAVAARPARSRPALRMLGVAGAALMILVGVTREGSGLFGGFGAILGLSLVMLLVVRPLLDGLRFLHERRSALGRPVGPAGVQPGTARLLLRLGVREAIWRPEVVSVALAALALAVATSMGVGLMVESLRADVARMMDQRLSGDLYVSGPAAGVAAAARWLETQLGDLRVSRYGEAQVRVSKAGAAGGPVLLGYTTFDVAESARYGHAGPLGAGEAIVNERLARDLDVGPGSIVRVGAAELEIVQVFAGFGDAAPRLLVDVAALPAIGLTAAFDRLGVYLGDLPIEGASAVAVSLPVSRVEVMTTRLAERFPALEVVGRELLRQRAFELFDRTFAMTRALTLLALLVAGVGIYNALTALRLNQVPTRRLLEAQGVLAHELALVTFARAGIVGLISVGVAAPLGIGMAWVLCQVINPRAFGWTVGLVLETRGWLPPLALGLGASLLAGLLPAPRERGALDEAV